VSRLQERDGNLGEIGFKLAKVEIESATRAQDISETISKTLPMFQRCMRKMNSTGVSELIILDL
jgi:hypothetical protein